MGHDILAYAKDDSRRGWGDEIAYYRRNFVAEDREDIYKALKAESAYGGVSGLGETMEFSEGELWDALKYLHDNNSASDTKEFVRKALDQAKVDGSVLISFC